MKPPKPIYSFLAAAILAAITLVTFAVFQDYGPQSAIRRFHRAVLRKDGAEANQLLAGGLNSPEGQALVNFVDEIARSSNSYEIVGMRRDRGAVVASVEYHMPNGMAASRVWYVRKQGGEWKIDAFNTLTGIPRQLFGG